MPNYTIFNYRINKHIVFNSTVIGNINNYIQKRHNSEHNEASIMPNIYTEKKAANKHTKMVKSNNNHAGVPRYYPPAVKEWSNSIYAFNKNTIKTLCNSDKTIFKLIKSYFNSYSLKLSNKMKSRRMRIRNRKVSLNRLLVSKPDLKHTGDEINITVYTYDKRNSYYFNKINKGITMDSIIKTKDNSLYSLFIRNLKGKSLRIGPKIINSAKTSLDGIKLDKHISLLNKFTELYFNSYIYKYMWREIVSVKYKQSILFEQSKHEKQSLLLLIGLLEKIYNKKVTFNVVNLKYFYNSSSIFSEALIAKIKNRINKPTRVLKSSLNTFTLPPINKLAVYNDIYRKKNVVQNLSVHEIILYDQKLSEQSQNKDILNESLLKLSDNFKTTKNPMIDVNKVMQSLRHKFTSGIRIEIAGRLTKRNTAERSMFKLRYKGNIKNTDSSFKGLSAVLLRGHAKSNIIYNKSKSKLRIGSFGLKTWISSD